MLDESLSCARLAIVRCLFWQILSLWPTTSSETEAVADDYLHIRDKLDELSMYDDNKTLQVFAYQVSTSDSTFS